MISIGRGQGTDGLVDDVGRSVRKSAEGGQAAAVSYAGFAAAGVRTPVRHV